MRNDFSKTFHGMAATRGLFRSLECSFWAHWAWKELPWTRFQCSSSSSLTSEFPSLAQVQSCLNELSTNLKLRTHNHKLGECRCKRTRERHQWFEWTKQSRSWYTSPEILWEAFEWLWALSLMKFLSNFQLRPLTFTSSSSPVRRLYASQQLHDGRARANRRDKTWERRIQKRNWRLSEEGHRRRNVEEVILTFLLSIQFNLSVFRLL